MADQVNDVFAVTLLNLTVSASQTNLGAPTSVSQFENGVSIAWNVVSLSGAFTHTLAVEESDTENGVYTPVAADRFIFPELFVKKFGTNNILELTAETQQDALVSFFGLRDLKAFIQVEVTNVLSSAGTVHIIVNMFAKTENSPVLENQLTVPGHAPRPILEP